MVVVLFRLIHLASDHRCVLGLFYPALLHSIKKMAIAMGLNQYGENYATKQNQVKYQLKFKKKQVHL